MRGVAAVLARVFSSRRLRGVELAFLGFSLAEYGVWTAVLVYAYGRGGATASGLIAVAQLVPAALVAPFAATVADSRGGAFALQLGYVLQAGSVSGAAALMLAGGPALSVYLLAIFAATAVTLTRPAQAKRLSSLVDRPEQLTAATAVAGWIESVSALGGPLLAGIFIAVSGTGAAMAAFGFALTVAAILVWTRPAERDRGRPETVAAEGALSGLRVLRRDPASRALVMIMTAEHLVIGALDVIVVVLAIAALRIGPAGAGYLNALFGVGAALGGAAGVALSGARSVARQLSAAGLAWAATFALLGAHPVLLAAVLLLPAAGGGQAVVNTAGRALLARVTPHEVLGRVFGLLEAFTQGGLALGALLVPIFVAVGGVRLALIGTAALLALGMLLPLRSLRHLDAFVPPAEGIGRLRAHPLFAGLPPSALEGLARELAAVSVPAGAVVIAEGEVGDRFYLIEEGELEVTITGEYIRTLGPGDGFGEIALLHDVLRTATVTARTDCRLDGLGRRPFLDALRPAF
jgi:MFS family permease